jgi:ketosteroid isomerase-like protein
MKNGNVRRFQTASSGQTGASAAPNAFVVPELLRKILGAKIGAKVGYIFDRARGGNGAPSVRELQQDQKALTDSAVATMMSHERFSNAGDLDGVMSNIHDDLVCLFPNMPLIEGKEAFKRFYGGLLGMGAWQNHHDINQTFVSGDAVVMHGKDHGTLAPPGADAMPFSNNFVAIFRPDADGKMKFWRAAFAPDH